MRSYRQLTAELSRAPQLPPLDGNTRHLVQLPATLGILRGARLAAQAEMIERNYPPAHGNPFDRIFPTTDPLTHKLFTAIAQAQSHGAFDDTPVEDEPEPEPFQEGDAVILAHARNGVPREFVGALGTISEILTRANGTTQAYVDFDEDGWWIDLADLEHA